MKTKTTIYLAVSWLFLVAGFAVSCASQGRRPFGIQDGRLAPCPDNPNCVSSDDAAGRSRIEPISFAGTPAVVWKALRQTIQGMGGKIAQEDGPYMAAAFKSRVFRFVDDLECRMDVAGQRIHVRSAARLGYSDFGANRRRVESLRRRFSEEQNDLSLHPSESDK